MKQSRKIVMILGAICAAGLLCIAACNACVIAGGAPVFAAVEEVPDAPVAVILGAAVWNNKVLSHVLEDRVIAGIALYEAGKVRKLLMSGAAHSPYYNEVEAMLRYAAERGVPPEDVFLDPAGFSTYESMYRARHVFGIRDAVIVTQNFHLARSVYTAKAHGINAVGLIADRRPYRNILAYQAREILARVKAWLEVELLQPVPSLSGAPVSVDGDGRITH